MAFKPTLLTQLTQLTQLAKQSHSKQFILHPVTKLMTTASKIRTKVKESDSSLEQTTDCEAIAMSLPTSNTNSAQQAIASFATRLGSIVTLGVLSTGLIAFGTQQVMNNFGPQIVEHIAIEAIDSLRPH